MPPTIEFTPEQIAKARLLVASTRAENEDEQLRDELEEQLVDGLDGLLELAESEPIPRSDTWTAAHIQQGRRVCELAPLTAPSLDGAREAMAELTRLKAALRSSLGTGANELLDWCQQRDAQLKKELPDDLYSFHALLARHGESTVWQLCNLSGLSQPTVSRRLRTLAERDLVGELPPTQPKWTVIE